MLERWAKIGCENATVGKNGLIGLIVERVKQIVFLIGLTEGYLISMQIYQVYLAN